MRLLLATHIPSTTAIRDWLVIKHKLARLPRFCWVLQSLIFVAVAVIAEHRESLNWFLSRL